MGSVKDLILVKKPEVDKPGEGIFYFSDRYSVFDWGEMPDHIENKGEAINILAAYFFELLNKKGVKTHYKGLILNNIDNNKKNNNDDKIKCKNEFFEGNSNFNNLDLNELKKFVEKKENKECKKVKIDKMKIKLVNVYKPELKANLYDYNIYSNLKGNYLIPLEIIYRNKITEGSSFLKRYKEKKLDISDYGLNSFPELNRFLNKPIIDFSTKLEITDRYISKEEAKNISGLSEKEFNDLIDLLMFINELITEEYKKIGFENIDGKIEIALDENRNLMVVDVLGTLDECRFFYNDIHISKEILRIYYRNTQWYNDVEEAKKINRFNWKNICKSKPEKLPEGLKNAISNIYLFTTNKITGINYFQNVYSIDESLKIIKKFINI